MRVFINLHSEHFSPELTKKYDDHDKNTIEIKNWDAPVVPQKGDFIEDSLIIPEDVSVLYVWIVDSVSWGVDESGVFVVLELVGE